MKKGIAILFVIIGFTACIKHATNPLPTSVIDTTSIFNLTSYINNGIENKSQFDGYSFQFSADGSLIANKSGLSTVGEWAATKDSLFIKKFNTLPFTLLNKSWKINSLGVYNIDVAYSNGIDNIAVVWKR